MEENIYYDGTKLLSLSDINGEKPEIYICTTNRTGGKTTYFGRWAVRRYKKGQGKFMLIYRYNYELDDCADKFFKDIKSLFFPTSNMTSKKKARGVYHELFLDEKSCGYAVALNQADAIKKYSHLFSDTTVMIFDEFQSETNHYCTDEVKKFLSIHTSVARGQGEQRKYLPVVMIGNPVTLLNPYYVEMNITQRLATNTKFLRGEGFVLEQGYNKSASEAMKNSGVMKAFANNSYVAYSGECVYLNDSQAFIEKPENCVGKYIATIKYKDSHFAIREYRDLGILYCDDHADITFPNRISVTTDDHNINYVMLRSNDMFIANMRYFFEHGAFRFKDLRSKEAILKLLSY